ncbi:MAG: DUF2384 domain-containing protein [bacterium]
MSEAQRDPMLDVTIAVMNLLDEWKLNTAQLQAILALPENVRARSFNKFREGREALPAEPIVVRRAQYLLRIADALRTAYPMNPKMKGTWIHQRQRRFGRRTPLTMILEGGEAGLSAVLSELDCTFSWDCTGSKPVTSQKPS